MTQTAINGATIGFERDLWAAADALRDALLPKFIRGEMRVKDAERYLKERGI